MQHKIILAVHGGAGTIRRDSMSTVAEAAYRATITLALQAGHRILASGGASLDAVVAAVQVFEDDPLFNAGKGAVFAHEGHVELDAAVMDGFQRHGDLVQQARPHRALDLLGGFWRQERLGREDAEHEDVSVVVSTVTKPDVVFAAITCAGVTTVDEDEELDAAGATVIICPLPAAEGLGIAIRDRLTKAAR